MAVAVFSVIRVGLSMTGTVAVNKANFHWFYHRKKFQLNIEL